MSDVITGTGEYTQYDKGTALVVHVEGGYAFGFGSGGGGVVWHAFDGRPVCQHASLRITGPWIPEPPPEWTPTNELRWKLSNEVANVGTVYVGSAFNSFNRGTLEQRWTNGTDSEWRPVTTTGD